uniref:Uncharacterized protein n=1 Tax=Rhizophora mucronata TaxID=61149 RepID=A0A2P2J206_RHIMU
MEPSGDWFEKLHYCYWQNSVNHFD